MFTHSYLEIASRSSLFINNLCLHSNGEYLKDSSSWNLCTAPDNIVQFHVGMFATLLALSCLEIILCAIQMVNGLVGCLCGTCAKKTVRWSTLSVQFAV